MFRKLFKKKGQAKTPDVILGVPNHIKKKMDGYAGSNTKTIFADYLKTVGRVQLLAIGDDPWYKKHKDHDWLVEAYDDAEWQHDWPLGKHQYETGLPSLIMATIRDSGKNHIDLHKLVKQIVGIQKKLDKLMKLLDSKEVTMSVKTAMTL